MKRLSTVLKFMVVKRWSCCCWSNFSQSILRNILRAWVSHWFNAWATNWLIFVLAFWSTQICLVVISPRNDISNDENLRLDAMMGLNSCTSLRQNIPLGVGLWWGIFLEDDLLWELLSVSDTRPTEFIVCYSTELSFCLERRPRRLPRNCC